MQRCNQAQPGSAHEPEIPYLVDQGSVELLTRPRADLLTTLAIFGKLAYKQLDVMGLIGREHIRESSLYAEIGDEARIETAQAAVLTVLDERFGSQAAASCRDAMQRVTKQYKLLRLLRTAARCANIEAFQRGLRAR